MAEVDLVKYNQFIQDLDLQNIYLVASRTEVKRFPNALGLHFHIEKEIKPPLPFDPSVNRVGGFQAAIKYGLVILDHQPVEGEPSDPLVIIEAVWAAAYASKRQPSKEEFALFAEQSLPLNLWPYFRQYVQNTTFQIGFPPLVLPVFKVLPLIKEQAQPNDSK